MGDENMLESEVLVTRREDARNFLTKLVEGAAQKGVNWGRKYSLFQYPFVTALASSMRRNPAPGVRNRQCLSSRLATTRGRIAIRA